MRQIITEHGGILQDPRIHDASGSRISLAYPGMKCYDPSKDLFDVKFITDCVHAGRLLKEQLKDYLITDKSVYKDYDPAKVLMGKITWDQLEKVLDDEVDGECKLLKVPPELDLSNRKVHCSVPS